MCIKILLTAYTLLSVFVGSTFFDQSQSGDLNVQVDLKGLKIIAILKGGKEEYVDYDYAYDYSEMTIKPQNRTTPRPLNVTSTTVEPVAVKDNITLASTVILETTTTATQTSETVGITLDQTINYDKSTIKSQDGYYNATDSPVHIRNATVATTSIPSSNITTCKKGFVLNSKGNCQLKLPVMGNVFKLSQIFKLRRESKNNSTDAE